MADLYMRDYIGDPGGVHGPSQAVSSSPDIIPYADQILSFATATTSYGSDLGKSVFKAGGPPNNIYARAKNMLGQSTTGSVQMYYAASSLLLTSNNWLPNVLKTAGGSPQTTFKVGPGNATIPQGAVALSDPPLTLSPPPLQPGQGDHYCFISVITTATTPAPTIPSTFASNAAFSRWVQQTPSVTWRNFWPVPAGSPSVSSTLGFGNTNLQPIIASFLFTASGYPTGSTVHVQCTDSQCPIDQTLTLPAPAAGGAQIVGIAAQSVPAQFTTGTVTITVTAPQGQPFAPGATLAAQYFQYPSQTITEDEQAASRVVPLAHTRGEETFVTSAMMIPLGDCTFVTAAGV